MTVLPLDRQKLATLANVEGFTSLDELLQAAALDLVSLAICVPDQDRG
jgi:hypothetical protein